MHRDATVGLCPPCHAARDCHAIGARQVHACACDLGWVGDEEDMDIVGFGECLNTGQDIADELMFSLVARLGDVVVGIDYQTPYADARDRDLGAFND